VTSKNKRKKHARSAMAVFAPFVSPEAAANCGRLIRIVFEGKQKLFVLLIVSHSGLGLTRDQSAMQQRGTRILASSGAICRKTREAIQKLRQSRTRLKPLPTRIPFPRKQAGSKFQRYLVQETMVIGLAVADLGSRTFTEITGIGRFWSHSER